MSGNLRPDTITGRINATALDLLEKHREGLRYTDLLARIREADPGFHPKTVNGCVWKLVERFPDKVCKPEKGLFRLVKHGFEGAEEPKTGMRGSSGG